MRTCNHKIHVTIHSPGVFVFVNYYGFRPGLVVRTNPSIPVHLPDGIGQYIRYSLCTKLTDYFWDDIFTEAVIGVVGSNSLFDGVLAVNVQLKRLLVCGQLIVRYSIGSGLPIHRDLTLIQNLRL